MVDYGPTCGNILAVVGPAAIEMGLITKLDYVETTMRIRLVNNGGLVEAVVQTPGGQVTYDCDVAIDGLPGTAVPIQLNFIDIVGSNELLPTGRLHDVIGGVEVTCIDCVVPTVVARTVALGKTGYESKAELDADGELFRRVKEIRRISGEMVGHGDEAGRVIPKFSVVAEPRRQSGSFTARYLVPTVTHPSMAVTEAISVSCYSVLEGTVAYDVSVHGNVFGERTFGVTIEHPSGEIQIVLKAKKKLEAFDFGNEVYSAGAVRTARLLFTGMVRVPNRFSLDRLPHCEMSARFCQLFRRGNLKHRVHVKARPKSPRLPRRSCGSNGGAAPGR